MLQVDFFYKQIYLFYDIWTEVRQRGDNNSIIGKQKYADSWLSLIVISLKLNLKKSFNPIYHDR